MFRFKFSYLVIKPLWSRVTKYISALRAKSTQCSRILQILFRLSLLRAGNLLQKSPRLSHPTQLFLP